MTKRVTVLLILSIGLGLIFSASAAYAGERANVGPGKWYAPDGGSIQVKARHAGMGAPQAEVALYDQNWEVIAEGQPTGGSLTFEHLKAGDYHILAYTDDLQSNLAQDVPVYAQKTTTVQMKLEKPAAAKNSLWNRQSGTCGAAIGDGHNLKIFPTYDQHIVYWQCGHIVGEVGGGSCGCGGAGGWRYTTTCKKGGVINISLPCPRRHN